MTTSPAPSPPAASAHETGAVPTGLVSKHRIEALTDGLYAIAMTLLVIELKLGGEHGAITTAQQLNHALAALFPKMLAWIISFFVLAFFWLGHHRLFQHVRLVDAQMLWANIAMLCAASLMPFSSALVGEYAGAFTSQCFYAINLAVLALTALWMLYIARKTPALLIAPLADSVFIPSRFRIVSLIVLCAAAIIIGWFAAPFATIVFAAMPIVSYVSRSLAAKAQAAETASG